MKILLKRGGSKFSSIRVSINLSLFQKKRFMRRTLPKSDTHH